MPEHRYTARIERLADGRFRAEVDAFGGFAVYAATVDELKARTPGELDAHIDSLQRAHEPVITSDGVDFDGPA